MIVATGVTIATRITSLISRTEIRIKDVIIIPIARISETLYTYNSLLH